MKYRLIKNRGKRLDSYRGLKGNTRISVMFEPLWGIPFVLFNFYLSLYMKELGVTDVQLGYLISLGFISGTVFSLFGGVITDRLGRKKTTVIFDFISWPVSIIIYAVSGSFVMFALATATNSVVRIVGVSWNLLVIEDATNDQRIAAYNLLNIITISTGIIIPAAGILVNAFGVVTSERMFLIFAAVSMSVMIFTRNHFYRETENGLHILEENRKNPVKINFKSILPLKAAGILKKNPAALKVFFVYILFNLYIPLGTVNSLYFAPYMTEALGLGKSTVSILGGVYSAVMLLVFVFLIPYISRFNTTVNMTAGLGIQAVSLALLVILAPHNLFAVILCIVLYSVGFGTFKPFIDPLLAEVTEGRDRAGIYSLFNTLTCIATAIIGVVSGALYLVNPRLIYIASIVILLACMGILASYKKKTGMAVGGGQALSRNCE